MCRLEHKISLLPCHVWLHEKCLSTNKKMCIEKKWLMMTCCIKIVNISYSYIFDMENRDIIMVWTQRQSINFRGWNAIFDVQRSLIQQQQGICRNGHQYGWNLFQNGWNMFICASQLLITINFTHFSRWTCYFVDNISKNNVLIIQRHAQLFPLNILP